MNKFTPKVSIIIPVYNGSNYLKEAIDSALNQTYKNVEIIVVNDGSRDDGSTDAVAKSYGKKIEYYNKENGGVSTALNLGLEKMTGEYFSWLSHDDIYKPNKIKKQIEYLRTVNDKKVILYSDYDLINSKGDFITKNVLDHEMLERVPIYALLRGSINGITLLIPKSAFDEYGEFDALLRCTQDYDMWFKMMKTYKFVHLEYIQTMTRIHPGQDTSANPAAVSEANVLWKRIIKELPDDEKIKAEGSLLLFYFEMAKFLKQTPYNKVLEYCEQQLESIAQSTKISKGTPNKNQTVIETYELLVDGFQKRAAAYYLESVIKQLVNDGDAKSAAHILSEELVGKEIGIPETNIKNNYLPKVGNKSKKTRLMFCTGHWLTGGMERVLSNLFKQLSDEYEIFLLTAYDGNVGKIDLPAYVTHIKMSNEHFYSSFDYIALSYAFIFNIDVAIGFMNLFGGQLDFYELCVGTKVKTVAANNEMYFYPYHNSYYYGTIQKRTDVFKNVDAVLWMTNFSAAAYNLNNKNGFLMPNPNTYKVSSSINKPEGKIVLAVGRFNDYVKRIDRIVECFSIVSRNQPDAKLMLVGQCNRSGTFRPDDDTTINDLLEKFNVDEKKVIFVGEVEDVESYYAQASLLLLTSNSEGFGMVINEAACFGVPSVCNKIPGLEDLVVDGKNGFLVDQGDIKTLADRVIRILSDDKLREALGENAKKIVTKFDETKIADKWKYLIKVLLEKDSNDAKYSKLNIQLDHQMKDYKKLSEELFDEINYAIAANLEEKNNQLPFAGMSKNRRRYHRLKEALKTKGVLQTSQIVLKMIHRKLRAERK